MEVLKVAATVLLLAWLGVSVWRSARRDDNGRIFELNPVGLVLPAICFFIAVFVILPSFGQVPAGSRGVVLQFGAVTGEVKAEGLYFVTPFVQRVHLMNVQIHAHKAPAAAASKDMQNVDTEITLNYRLEPNAAAIMYRDIGMDYEGRIITPSVQEAVKAATAKYDAEKLITERSGVRGDIEQALRDRLANHHITLDQLSITNFSFSREFADAIEAKQVALQLALKAENEVKQARFAAESRIASARGEAEAIRIQADAIRSQGGAEYVNLKAIEKWNGVLPTWMAGGSVPFVSVPTPR